MGRYIHWSLVTVSALAWAGVISEMLFDTLSSRAFAVASMVGVLTSAVLAIRRHTSRMECALNAQSGVLRNEIIELRSETAGLRSEIVGLRAEIAGLRDKFLSFEAVFGLGIRSNKIAEIQAAEMHDASCSDTGPFRIPNRRQ